MEHLTDLPHDQKQLMEERIKRLICELKVIVEYHHFVYSLVVNDRRIFEYLQSHDDIKKLFQARLMRDRMKGVMLLSERTGSLTLAEIKAQFEAIREALKADYQKAYSHLVITSTTRFR